MASHVTITVSQHAFTRARQRLNFNKKVTIQMAKNAFKYGKMVSDDGTEIVTKYMSDKRLRQLYMTEITKEYSGCMFIFAPGKINEMVLVTVYRHTYKKVKERTLTHKYNKDSYKERIRYVV